MFEILAPLALFRDRSAAPLFVARLVSSAGVGFGQLALAWGVLRMGYGPGELSMVMACKAAPAILIIFGGIAGDRFRRHHVLMAAELLATLTWLSLGVCFLTRKAPLPLLCSLAALSGVAAALFLPTIRGIVADVLSDDRRLAGNALVSQTESAGLLIGLVSSGVVVSTLGPGWAAATRGALCAVSALLLGGLRTSRRGSSAGMLGDLRAGWREFAAYRWVWTMALQFTALIIAVACFTDVIGPLYMSQGHGGARAWGVISACEAFGALAGALIGANCRVGNPMLLAMMLPASASFPMLLISAGFPWGVIAVAIFLPGIGQAAYYVLWTTALQDCIPREILVRVNSWSIVASYFAAPFALLAAGPMIKKLDPQGAALGAGTLILLATIITLLSLRSTSRGPTTGSMAPERIPAS